MNNPEKSASPPPRLRAVLRYGLAPVAIAAAFGLARLFLHFHWGQPFAVFAFCVIAVTFWYGGIGPGIFATALAALVRIYLPDPEVIGAFRLVFDLVFVVYAVLMIEATKARHELELRVAKRTTDLRLANEELKREIAERAHAEEKLRQSEFYLAEAQRIAHVGSWIWRGPMDRDPLHPSDEWFRLFGFDPKGGIPKWEQQLERIHPEDRDKWVRVLEEAARNRSNFDIECRLVLPAGSETGVPVSGSPETNTSSNLVRHIHTIGHPVLDARGVVIEYVGTVVDITERKRAEEERHAVESRFRTYVDHATDALFVHDEDGTILDVNQMACESLGYSRGELIGVSPAMFDVLLDAAHIQLLHQQLDSGQSFTLETSHRRKDGSVIPVEVRTRPFWHDGRRFGLSLARDIAERKRAEAERERLHQLQADLARTNRINTLGELTASLAHEINQPIAAAVTDANTCLRWLGGEPPNLEKARDAARRAVKDATRASEIIIRTRLLFQKSPSQFEPVSVNDVIREMIALLHSELSRRGVSVQSELTPDLPQVMGDRIQLQQVLMNLMVNGIDAMNQIDGRRELILRSQRESGDQLLISVSDTGVGLPLEKTKLFDTFFTTKQGGTGMGLAISRTIIDAHGGRLWAISNSGAGATFCFTLPLRTEAHP